MVEGTLPEERFAHALESLADDKELLAETASVCIRAFAQSGERLAKALQDSIARDAEIAEEAHKLIFGWDLFAPRGQSHMARNLEDAAVSGNWARVEPLLRAFIEQLASVQAELNQLLGRYECAQQRPTEFPR